MEEGRGKGSGRVASREWQVRDPNFPVPCSGLGWRGPGAAGKCSSLPRVCGGHCWAKKTTGVGGRSGSQPRRIPTSPQDLAQKAASCSGARSPARGRNRPSLRFVNTPASCASMLLNEVFVLLFVVMHVVISGRL